MKRAASGAVSAIIGLATFFALQGCGGGGSSSSGNAGSTGSTGSSGPTLPSLPSAQQVTLAGVVSTSSVLSGASVSAKCVVNASTTPATTDSNGNYTLTITVAPPCVLEATSGSTTLHSVAQGSGTSLTANVTDLTELTVANATGSSNLASYMQNLSSTSNLPLESAFGTNGSALTTAQNTVTTALSAAGVSTAGINNVFTDAPSTAGAAPDSAAQTSLVNAISTSGTSLSQIASTIGYVPATQLLQPAASNCSALQSGTYNVLWYNSANSAGSTTMANNMDTATVTTSTSSANVALSFALGTASGMSSGGANPLATLTPTMNGTTPIACDYTGTDGTSTAYVSKAGVIVARYVDGTAGTYIGIMVPQQTLTLAALAGNWTRVVIDSNNGTTNTVNSADFTFSSTGTVSNVTNCQGLTSCAAVTSSLPTLTVDSTGWGFDLTAADGSWTERYFAYQSGSSLLMVGIDKQARPKVMPVQATLALPAGGPLNIWNPAMDMTPQATSNVGGATITIMSGSGSSFILQQSNSSTSTYLTSWSINQPLAGWWYEAQQTVTATDGSQQTDNTRFVLPLQGMGMFVNVPFALNTTTPTKFGFVVLH